MQSSDGNFVDVGNFDKTFEAYSSGSFTLQQLRDKFNELGLKRKSGKELTEKFLKYNMELANDRTNEENTHLFKKVGSNFLIKDRTVLFEPRGAWKTLLDSGIFGGNAFVSRPRRDPLSASNSDFQFWRRGQDSNLQALAGARFIPHMAEGIGFEPMRDFSHTLSKRAP